MLDNGSLQVTKVEIEHCFIRIKRVWRVEVTHGHLNAKMLTESGLTHTDIKARGYGACTGTPVQQTPGGLPVHDPEDSRGGEASHRFLKHSALSPSDQSTIRVLRASLSASVSSPLSLSMWMACCLSETLGTAQHQTRGLWWHASCPKESIIVFANVFRHPGVWRRLCVRKTCEESFRCSWLWIRWKFESSNLNNTPVKGNVSLWIVSVYQTISLLSN